MNGQLSHPHRKRRNRRKRAPAGTVATECALLLPFVLLMAFATLEICSALYVRQTIKTIAFEGARVGVRRHATQGQSVAMCTQLLTDRGIQGGTISVTPADFSTLNALQPISVTVQAPLDGNCWFINQFLRNGQITATVQMVREYDD